MSTLLRHLPSISALLEVPEIQQAVAERGREAVTDACRRAVEATRETLRRDTEAATTAEALQADVATLAIEELARAEQPSYRPTLNAAGVILHTNLGRAPLDPSPANSATAYLALEYDLETGKRGQRLAPLRDRLAEVAGAESAVMVNNCAAALLLILQGVARGRNVIVSRSQLIEIGGSFRLPAVMEAAGCRLVEVGCTNRTHLDDYRRAINEDTAAILVAHQSNFRIVGFTAVPDDDELAALAHEHDLPLIVDQGSGCLHDLERWGLPHEVTVGELLGAGADIVCFSGDKLLGGPQAGVIVGTRRWVQPLGRHPLYRALRCDKVALAMMDRTLRAHQTGRLHEIPVYQMLSTSVEALQRRARRIVRRLKDHGLPATSCATRCALGGGTTPDETMRSHGFRLPGGHSLADALRKQDPPVVGRLVDDDVVFDLRTVPTDQDRILTASVTGAWAAVNR
jgi:L-seryl-tRNA(Ser) seleniumtransferase